jgi:dCTP diphosphatase
VKKTFDLEKLENIIDQFSQERDWNQFHSAKNLSMALSVEASELLEIFQWMTEAESNAVILNEEKFTHVQEEVADILVYLIRLSSRLNINLEEAVLSKMKKNALKYPLGKN